MSRVSLLIFMFVIAASTCSFSVSAQAAVEISMEPRYASDLWFNLDKGVVHKHAADDWDIAFQVNDISGGLIVNEAAGLLVYHVPNSDADTWKTTIDTTEMRSSWTLWFNAPDAWHNGAFNMDVDYTTGSYGWGQYNPATHGVSGIAVFVIIDRNGQARKFFCESLTGGVLTIKYADLDGSNEFTGTIDKAAFNGRIFGYYNLQEHKTIDREPAIDSWDLNFARYIEMLGPNQDIPFVVAGVRSNLGVTVAVVDSDDPAGVAAPEAEAYTDFKRAIGYDWKTFEGGQYTIDEQRVHFVKRADESIYRLVFRGFAGSASGNIELDVYPPLSTTSVADDVNNQGALLYPNVVTRGQAAQLAYAAQGAQAQLYIYDLQGRSVQQRTIRNAAELETLTIATDQMHAGSYIVELRQGAHRSQRRLVIR